MILSLEQQGHVSQGLLVHFQPVNSGNSRKKYDKKNDIHVCKKLCNSSGIIGVLSIYVVSCTVFVHIVMTPYDREVYYVLGRLLTFVDKQYML